MEKILAGQEKSRMGSAKAPAAAPDINGKAARLFYELYPRRDDPFVEIQELLKTA